MSVSYWRIQCQSCGADYTIMFPVTLFPGAEERCGKCGTLGVEGTRRVMLADYLSAMVLAGEEDAKSGDPLVSGTIYRLDNFIPTGALEEYVQWDLLSPEDRVRIQECAGAILVREKGSPSHRYQVELYDDTRGLLQRWEDLVAEFPSTEPEPAAWEYDAP